MWMIIFRFLQAMGGGAIIPICIVGVSLILEKKYWIYGFGLIGASAELGGVIGPLWGSLIVEYFDWETAFLINIPISLLIIFLMYFLPKSRIADTRIKIFDIVIFSLIITLATYLISEYNGIDFSALVIILALLVLSSLFLIRILKKQQNFIPNELFDYKSFLTSSFIHFFVGASLIVIMVTIPLSASTIHQMDNLEIGLSLLNLTLFIGVVSILGIFISKLSNVIALIIS